MNYHLQKQACRSLFVSALVLAALSGSLRAVALVQKPIWDLNELGNAPKWSALESPVSSSGQVKAIFFTGLSFKGKPNRVFAWLGIPKVKPGEKVPGIVLVHGGGGTAFEEWVRLWVDRGYAAIAMDTCGQVPVGTSGHWVKDDQGGPPGGSGGSFQQMDWDPKDQWTYQAVADVVLAHSLLRSLPEVDAERTGLTGISWGGYLTCIAAGVDNRFKFAVPVYGCGFYPDTVFTDALGKLNAEQRDRWMSWWDPSVYLGAAKMPMLWVDGSNDHFYYLKAVQRSYRLPQGPRSVCVRLRMPHGQGEGEKPPEIQCFADSILKDGIPLPTITGQGRDGTNVWATFTSKVRVTKAELNYTKDTGNWEKRKWETLPATSTNNKVTAVLPGETRMYFLNLTDERDCMLSIEHEECGSF